VQGTGRNAHLTLQTETQSSFCGVEENKYTDRSYKRRHNHLASRVLHADHQLQHLSRPSLSEQPPTTNFSPQFDKRTSHSREELLDDNPSCRGFDGDSSKNATFHGGGQAHLSHRPSKVDGVFRIGLDVEAAQDDEGKGME